MWAGNTTPPENRFKEGVIFLLLHQGGSGHIKIQVRIPSADFPGPGVIGIAEMRANDRQFWKASGHKIQPGDSHAIGIDIRSDFRMRAIDDSGMEEKHHAILLGSLIDWPVAPVIIRVLWTADFAETTETRGVKLVDNIQNIGRIKFNFTKADEPSWVLLHK